jgi:hypothetical protein
LTDRNTTPFDTVDFVSFLVEAKRSAGPSASLATARQVLPGAVQLEYSRGLYVYRNIYCGFERFSGQETVHYNNQPIWGMGYSGGLVNHYMWDLQPQWIYAVLRAALAQVSEELPFRGPLRYEYYGFKYANHPLGHLGEFLGEETIRYREALIYHLWYVGGFVS